MSKTILKRVPDENVWYNFEDECYFKEDEDKVIITGNDRMQSFGSSALLDIVNGDYWDDDIDLETGEVIGYDYDMIPELEKVTGKNWQVTTIKGYSQGDWQMIYYTDEVSPARLKELEAFYMGKIDEYHVYEDENDDDHYCVFIPHDICWDGKKAICKYLGLDPKETIVYEDDGFKKVYNYKEME